MNDGSAPMKVCVVNPNYYRSSGVTVAARRIFHGVTPLGIEQHFVDCRHGSQEEDISWIPPGRLLPFLLMDSHPVRLFQQTAAFLRWLRREGIGLVHVHHRRLAALLYPLQGFGRFRLIYTAQLSYPAETWFALTSPRSGVAISPSVAENLKKTTRITRIDIIGNPSDFPPECPDVRVPDVRGTVICVARLDPVKAHVHLIAAWKILTERGIRAKLLLIGEGSLKQTLADQVDALGLTELVEFRGFQKDIPAEMNRCLFAVLASEVEGHPVVVMEAAARGRPTLVTDVDGSRDGVPPAAALTNRIPFGDPGKLADALAVWLEQPEAVVLEGRRFYDFHKEHHSTEVVGRRYAELYERTARNH